MENQTDPFYQKSSRRSMLKSMFATVLTTGAGMLGVTHAKTVGKQPKKMTGPLEYSGNRQPLIAQFTTHENFVFVKGMGEHDERDITVATTAVLDKIEEQLIASGSSMDKALKVTVFLRNLRHYDAMNDAYRGRFGDNPPARSTVACYNGIPGGSLLEIDCIAAL